MRSGEKGQNLIVFCVQRSLCDVNLLFELFRIFWSTQTHRASAFSTKNRHNFGAANMIWTSLKPFLLDLRRKGILDHGDKVKNIFILFLLFLRGIKYTLNCFYCMFTKYYSLLLC